MTRVHAVPGSGDPDDPQARLIHESRQLRACLNTQVREWMHWNPTLKPVPDLEPVEHCLALVLGMEEAWDDVGRVGKREERPAFIAKDDKFPILLKDLSRELKRYVSYRHQTEQHRPKDPSPDWYDKDAEISAERMEALGAAAQSMLSALNTHLRSLG